MEKCKKPSWGMFEDVANAALDTTMYFTDKIIIFTLFATTC